MVRVCPVALFGDARLLNASLRAPERDQCLKRGRLQPRPEALRSFLCKARARCMSGAYVPNATAAEMASRNDAEVIHIIGFLWLPQNSGQRLLQKSFWGDERNFVEPLMRFTSGDVREPYRFIQNRSGTSVVALKSNAAAEKSKDQLSRDF